MQELKKQLQECHEKEVEHDKEEKSHQGKKKTKDKETDKKNTKASPEELPFTPGVVLHFKSLDTEIQKKDIRVSTTCMTLPLVWSRLGYSQLQTAL